MPSTILQNITLDNTRGIGLTNRLVEIPLADTFDFASVSASGQDLDVLDSDGVTSLAHSLRHWGQDVGLKLLSTWTGPPDDGAGNVYQTAGQIAVADLGLPNPPHTLWAAGVIGPGTNPPAYGELHCYDRFGTSLWKFQSPQHDYIMSVSIGDVNGDGVPEVAVGVRIKDHKAYILNNTATSTLWTWDSGGTYYIRVATIGKMRNDLAGQEVLFATSLGDVALVDHLGNQLWIQHFPLASLGTIQAGIIADPTNSGQSSIYVIQVGKIRKMNNAGGVVWTFTLPVLTTSCFFQIACGHVTSTTTKQLVSATSPHDSTSTLGSVVCVDDTGASSGSGSIRSASRRSRSAM